MYEDPVTWSREERIARWREQADCFQKLAASDSRFISRDRLLELALQFNSWADSLQQNPRA
jgi:hypothetical protein